MCNEDVENGKPDDDAVVEEYADEEFEVAWESWGGRVGDEVYEDWVDAKENEDEENENGSMVNILSRSGAWEGAYEAV